MLTTNYYQPWLFPFLSFRKTSVSPGIIRYAYHSFEDGLWDLLQQYALPRGSVILVPDFYCMDVIDNIRHHGYRPVFYPLDDNFQIRPDRLYRFVRRYSPGVIIIFHACGIRSMTVHKPSWMRALPKETIIIEDCVHRLLDPSTVTIRRSTHYVMDSLRKVSPLPGSHMYTRKKLPNVTKRYSVFNRYAIASAGYYVLFRLLFVTAMTFRSARLIRFAHTNILKKHDDIIGDRFVPTRGFGWASWFLDRFDFKRIERHKARQVTLYRTYLSALAHPFYGIRIPKQDYGKLHVYPLGFCKTPDPSLIRYLHRHGVVVWYKFPDAPWSKNRGVLFLPLGFHVTDAHIRHIAGHLSAWQTAKRETALYS